MYTLMLLIMLLSLADVTPAVARSDWLPGLDSSVLDELSSTGEWLEEGSVCPSCCDEVPEVLKLISEFPRFLDFKRQTKDTYLYKNDTLHHGGSSWETEQQRQGASAKNLVG